MHAAHQHRTAFKFRALHGVASGHVRDFMRDDRSCLGGIIRERQQPARDIDIAVGQRESIDSGRIEDRTR